MAYLSTLSIGAFKKKAGRLIYFPWGIFGSGYEVQGWEQRRRLIYQGRICLGTSLFLLVLSALLGGWLALVAAAVILGSVRQLLVGHLTRNMPRSPERLGFFENLRNQAADHSFLSLWCVEAFSLGLVVLAAWALSSGAGLPILSMMIATLFLPCALIFGVMIREKLR